MSNDDMRYKLFTYIALSILILSIPDFVLSQTPSIAPAIPLIPGAPAIGGLNCGDAQSTQYNKCCYNKAGQSNFQIGGPFGPIAGVVSGLMKNQLNQVYQLQNQVATQPCQIGSPSTPGNISDPSCICIIPTDVPLQALNKLCDNVNTNEKNDCLDCLSGTGKFTSVGVWTGMGCIYTNLSSFIQKTLLGWGTGLAGIISILCLIYAAFTMQTSQGDPEKVKKAQQLLTSCITGLVLIIFSIFILRLIGVDILRIPGLAK